MRMSDALLLMTTPAVVDLSNPVEQLFGESPDDEAHLTMIGFLTSDEAVELLDNLDFLSTEKAKRSALFGAYILYLEELLGMSEK